MRKNKKILILITVLILLTSCRKNTLEEPTETDKKQNIGQEEETEEEKLFDFADLQISKDDFFDGKNTRSSKLIKYGNGYLYSAAIFRAEQENTTENIQYNLIYLDTDNNKWTLMCNNPACNHITSDCISYVTWEEMASISSNGQEIYTLKTERRDDGIIEENLYKINMDTFEREKLTNLFAFSAAASWRTNAPIIYGNYYYNAKDFYSETGDLYRILYRCRLEKDSKIEMIYDIPIDIQKANIEEVVTDIQAEGKYVFYVLECSDGIHIIRLDLENGEIFEHKMDSWSISVKDGKIYSVTDKKLCEYTYDFKETKSICQIEKEPITKIIADQNYLLFYLSEKEGRRICVYNYEGEELGEFFMEDKEWTFIDCDDKSLFFSKGLSTENEQIGKLDIEKIVNKEAVLEEITG